MPLASAPFRALFARSARRLRWQLALGHVLSGVSVGLSLGAGASLALREARYGVLRPAGLALGAAGAFVGLMVARRRRWTDESVALFLDARLGTREVILTAVELSPAREGSELDAAAYAPVAIVLSQAVSALKGAAHSAVSARYWRWPHATIPVAAVTIAVASILPLPPAPPPTAAPPGADQVRIANLAGLDAVLRLAKLDARDEAQRGRLEKLAAEAQRLREKLQTGVEKREAQADIGRLSDGITQERLSLGDGEQRQGMEAAIGKLSEDPDLKRAGKALGDRDLTALDEEMARLADTLERADRDRAMKLLEEAAAAAKKAGAPGVAKAVEEQRRRFAEHVQRSEALRQLARDLGEGLDQEGREALADLGHLSGSKVEQKLLDRLDQALRTLSPEQRRRVAANMRKKAAAGAEHSAGKPRPSEMENLARDIDSPEGVKRLEDELRRMAQEGGEGSREGERERRLDDAQRGARDGQRMLGGGMPIPVQTPGKPAPGPGLGGAGQGTPMAGHTEGGEGSGSHEGRTEVVSGDGVKAHAATVTHQGTPMPGIVTGRSSGRAGDTANVRGTGALGNAALAAIRGMERSDVPEAYREQVGRYFQSK